MLLQLVIHWSFLAPQQGWKTALHFTSKLELRWVKMRAKFWEIYRLCVGMNALPMQPYFAMSPPTFAAIYCESCGSTSNDQQNTSLRHFHRELDISLASNSSKETINATTSSSSFVKPERNGGHCEVTRLVWKKFFCSLTMHTPHASIHQEFIV